MAELLPVCLVTGASGGIGSALCRMLPATQWVVYGSGLREEKLTDGSTETGLKPLLMDVTDTGQIQTGIQQILAEQGRLDVVVHCVGSLLLKPAHLTKPEEWDKIITHNLTSAFYVLQNATQIMRKSGGSIVLISSAAARRGIANHEAIAAAKAGIIGLGLSAAATYAPNNIRINIVAPGLVDTALTQSITSNPKALETSQAMHPLKRIGKPEQVASMIAWLIQPQQDWVTGQVFGVDGGLSTLIAR